VVSDFSSRFDRVVRFARLPEKIGFRDHVIGASLALGYVVWLLATARSLGFPRDEGFYFRAGSQYAGWFRMLLEHPRDAMLRSNVDAMWNYNHEHPALMKSLFALSWMFFHEKWKLFADASTAFRFPAMCMAGMALWVTYLFGARAYSRRAGVIAAVLFALMPRVFFHAHLACFDIPITAMWTLCIYVYWRSVARGGIGWAIAAGIVYGLTLETKHNAWILPFVFVPHALFVHRRALWRQLRVGRLPLPTSLVAMATLGPLVFYVCWPWMWNDTIARVQEYASFHLNHEYYNMEFFGRNYFGPPSPRAYMPVMIAATVPAVTLLLFAIGAFDRAKVAARRLVTWGRTIAARGAPPATLASPLVTRDPTETDLLFALAFAAALGPFLLPKTPIFGGTKHWLTAYPFLVLFAGRGVDLVAGALTRALAMTRAASDRRVQIAAHAALIACIVAAPLAITVHSHPFGLTSYVPLVGGAPGAADLGLNRQFWGLTTQSANEWLAPNAPRGATVFIHDTAWDSWSRMIDEKRVRPDLRGVGSPSEAQIALVQHELHMSEVDDQIWMAFDTDAPVYVVTHDGVPVVSIYKRPE
jgi:4-amino-4-deoxy-L-arabinose transferase-like glycosyltransferase